MHGEPEVWTALMQVLSDSVVRYLRAQIDAGAQAVQLFDSWVGHLSPATYATHVLPWVTKIFDGIRDLGVPSILFGIVTGELLAPMSRSGCDVIGVDWRVPLDAARTRVPAGMTVQGNLDPAICLASWEVVEKEAHEVLERGAGGGHIFNLGHGVLPETDPDVLARLVDLVHTWKAPS
jgi:uroporphyrinogen decarboxylase